MMTWYAVVAIFLVVWWLCLFTVLPFGVRTQAEHEDGTVLGTVASAPARPMLVRKALITTLIAAIVTGGIWYAHDQLGWTLEAISKVFGTGGA